MATQLMLSYTKIELSRDILNRQQQYVERNTRVVIIHTHRGMLLESSRYNKCVIRDLFEIKTENFAFKYCKLLLKLLHVFLLRCQLIVTSLFFLLLWLVCSHFSTMRLGRKNKISKEMEKFTLFENLNIKKLFNGVQF